MKKLTFAAILCSSMLLTACHYGQDEAKDTLETNEKYKTENADYSVNRAGDGGKLNATNKTADSVLVDTAAKAAPEHAAPEHQ